MSGHTVRIAVAQPAITADARKNGATARRLVRAAAAEGARLVQFPEGLLSGYAKEQIQDWSEVDWSVVRDELSQVMALAARVGVWVVLGSAHPLTPPNRPHNSLYVISDRGEMVNRYDKQYCSHTEITRFYSPGFGSVTFEVDGFQFGCAVCVEINFPTLFSEYERLGVDCVLLSAYPVDSVFEVKARAYAALNCYWVAMSLPAQTNHLMDSGVIGPDGTYAAQVADELAVADLDRAAFDMQLTKARPWRASALNGDIYRRRRVDDARSRDRTCV